MILELYKNNSDDRTINKDVELLDSMDIQLKSDVDVTTPTLILKLNYELIEKANYIYIDVLNRYYFIMDVTSLNNEMYELNLQCDVIETYKNIILNSSAVIERPIKEGDYLNTNIDGEVIREVEIFESDVTLESDNKMVLSTISGVI